MAINFLNDVKVIETAAASPWTEDKFVVLDSGVLKYRTGAQVRSDIGAGTGNGTVTSVTVSGGTGLSGSGTVTTSGTITLTNSDRGSSQNIFKNVASDSGTAVADSNNDTLTIAGGTNVSTAVVGDTLTITATDTNTQYTAGTGLTLSGTVFNTNVDGTQSVAANTSTTTAARTYKVQVDSSDNLVVNVPWTSNSGTVTGTGSANYVSKWTSSSVQGNSTIYDNGNVGIGTNDPDAKLEISTSSAPILRLTSTDTSVNTGESIGRLEFKSNDVSTGGNNVMGFVDCLATNPGTTYALALGTGLAASATEKMRIDEQGDVGIGTTDPVAKLHINGGDFLLAGDYRSLYVGGRTNSFEDGIRMSLDNAGNGYFDHRGVGNLHFRVDSSQGATTRMVIEATGNVGIGTNIPDAKLDIFNTGGNANSLSSAITYSGLTVKPYSSVDSKLTFSANSGNTQIIQATNNSGSTGRQIALQPFNGNVGIGTTSPATKLEVEGGDALIQLSTTSSSGSPYMSFAQNGSRKSFIQHNDSGDTLKLASEYGGIDFYTGTSGAETEKMTIQSDGDVGIGLTSPSSKLHVRKAAGPLNSFNSNTIGIYETSGPGYVNVVTGATSTGELWFSDSSEGRGRVRYNHSDDSLQFWVANGEKLRIGVSGQIGIGGTNYGSSGQVLTSNGSGSAPSWQAAGGGSYTSNIVSSATTASKDNLYIFTASATLTLPANPSSGDSIKVSNLSGTTTCVIARNNKNIMAVGENMTLDNQYASFELIYSDATRGWVVVGGN
jgi:hypothetical protein